MSITLDMSGVGPKIVVEYYPPLSTHDSYEVAILSVETYNLRKNVTSSNNLFHYDQTKVVNIPEGCYSLTDIAEEIDNAICSGPPLPDKHGEIGNRALCLTGNYKTQKIQFICRYEVDFSKENSVGSSLGFERKKYGAMEMHRSSENISLRRIKSIRIECDIAKGSFTNSEQGHCIREIFLQSDVGYKVIDHARSPLIYYPISGKIIDRIEIRLCDQNGELLDLGNQVSRVKLHLRQKKNNAFDI